MKRSIGLVIVLTAGFGACDRLNEVGKAPGFSPVGGPRQPVVAGIDPTRAAMAVPPPVEARSQQEQASLWRSGPTSLFGDRRASRRGDILTMIIEIDDQAQIQNSSSRARSGSESVGVPALAGIPEIVNRVLPSGASAANLADVSSSSSSNGNGQVQRNEKITLRVAATVVDVLPNGHLVVQGSQEVRVNFELRDLQVAGIVRPEDISRQNQITYDKVAGARISYGGRGQITDVQQPRLGQQVADIILPF
ncbi:MAG: flagellar basal body L-ring protein FlgH [Pseudomonadota bacterium]